MELRQIVGAHDPDKAHIGAPASQIGNGVEGVACSDDSLETTDIDPRIFGHRPRRSGTLAEIVQRARILERVTRRNQPPDPVEFQPLQGI